MSQSTIRQNFIYGDQTFSVSQTAGNGRFKYLWDQQEKWKEEVGFKVSILNYKACGYVKICIKNQQTTQSGNLASRV